MVSVQSVWCTVALRAFSGQRVLQRSRRKILARGLM
ncbi:hypothetical protein DICVIV_07231, partial [Dictyocaulus viviparus]